MKPPTPSVRPRPGRALELLSIELLEEHARRLAALLSISTSDHRNARAHLKQLRADMAAMRQVYTALTDDARREAVTPAAEWLLDNFHLVSAAVRDIHHDLPASFFGRLPRVVSDEHEGMPRIYALAFELIGSSAGRLDASRLQRFLTAFQSISPLTMGELWAWPSMLKLALISELRVHGDVLAESREHRLAAERMFARVEAEPHEEWHWPDTIHHAFVTRLLQRGRSLGAAAAVLHGRLSAALEARGGTIEEAIQASGQHEATEQATIANLITSLRLIGTFDWSEFFESVSLVEQVLQRDPAGAYGRMDFLSRDSYRHAVEELAGLTGEAQQLLALKVVERAREAHLSAADARAGHVGHHLIGRGRRALERSIGWRPTWNQWFRRAIESFATPGYLGTIAAGTSLLVAVAVAYAARHGWNGVGLAVLAIVVAIPASEIVIQLLQRLVTTVLPPSRLPRFELTAVPASARTMVIVPTLFDSVRRVHDLIDHLEVQALGNLDPHVHFALLSDLPDAASESLPGDDAIVEAARHGIAALNAKHPGEDGDRFFLFHRIRQWNAQEGLWMGWERKRGKIEEFNRLLRGATNTSFAVTVGNLAILPSIKYCITLDSDTGLPRGVARELIGIITHPLNRPRIDPVLGRVTEGYGILQPRIGVTFTSAAGSPFARLYAGHTGVDPYTTAVSDAYQDLFGEGIFTGKGLYDVDAFMASVGDIVPENALLSHDLFEGLHARVALVSDLELVDDYPTSVLTHARRQHRWVRGDWQILRWLFPVVPSPRGLKRNTLALLARWKILDNLRRSLLAPTLIVMLVAGWLVLPGSPWFWTLIAIGAAASQLLPVAAQVLIGPEKAQSLPVYFRNLLRDTLTSLSQVLLSVILLAFHAVDAVHAIGVTLVRLIVTGRRMLEWETAAAAAARAAGLTGQKRLKLFWSEMKSGPIVAGVVLVLLVVMRRDSLGAALPFLALWAASPGIAYWLSVPRGPRARPLDEAERDRLRVTARKTWRFFDTFVTVSDNWLPPDNAQEVEAGVRIAHRTSPTNVAMSLLSNMAAHDLGYITTRELAERTDATLSTLEELERYRGHFLNWYDTTTLAPLYPRYVSTVDSGNLAASLIALAHGFAELVESAQTIDARLDGLADTAAVLASVTQSAAPSGAPRETVSAINRLARSMQKLIRSRDGQAISFPALEAMSASLSEQLEGRGGDRAPWPPELTYWVESVVSESGRLVAPPDVDAATLHGLSRRLLALADDMRFDFLYDRRRRLFAIGYRLGDKEDPGRLDASFYDLLASEARLASFVAIAKGDIPQHHWFHLGRLVTNVRGRATLMSWGGTMFEYLMPMLVTRTFRGTLLEQSCRASILRQMDYGRERGVPWGLSESAYAMTDREGTYQYRAFGVPGLGLRRGLSSELVVAPYATVLATMVTPAEAAANLNRLAADGAEGAFGFYEALDFTMRHRDVDAAAPASRLVVVRAFFAHHQGMSLVALANVLRGDAFVKRFHRDPRIQSTELLLQERVPREAILSELRPAEAESASVSPAIYASREFRSPDTSSIHTHVLSNGRYTVAITNAGGGYSTWRHLSITRRRDDPTSDAGAHFVYLRDLWTNQVWSATHLPVCRRPTEFSATFDLDKATFRRRDGDIETKLEITVSSEDDVEVRRLTVRNRGTQPREVELTSYSEIVLARLEDDIAHPAFGKLFIETDFDPQSAGLIFSRRPRSADEAPAVAFHVLGVDGPRLAGGVEWETDRSRFIGRGRTPAAPIALDGRGLSGTTGAVLDPVAALRERLRLAPGGSARMTFATGVAADRHAAIALARKYRDGSAAARAFSMAFTHVHVTLQHLGISDDAAMLFDRLASRVFGEDRSRVSPTDIAQNIFGQQNLWGFGLSGDLPVVLLRVAEPTALSLVRQVLTAQEYWRLKGLRADVVILNEHPSDYLDEMQQLLMGLLQEPPWSQWVGKSGGILLVRSDGMPEADRRLFGAVARVVLRADVGDLTLQLDRPSPWLFDELDVSPTAELTRPEPAAAPPTLPPLVMENGHGGFTPDGREYVVVLDGDRETPLPWSNVIANPTFGTIVSQSGSAFTWADNSRENRVTPFANDPLSDPTGEALFIRDEDSQEVWGATPAPLPRRPDSGRWVVRHAAGVTRYAYAVAGMRQELAVFVSPTEPVKISQLTLTNDGPRTRHICVFGYVEWIMGPPRPGERRFVVTERDETTGAILARNVYNTEFSDATSFFRTTSDVASFTCDRTEFVGRNRTLQAPAALFRAALGSRAGAGLDPCGAIQVSLMLAPGETREIAFVLGQGRDRAQATDLARRFASLETAHATLAATERQWDDILGALQVRTPDDSFDLIVNRWLLYQTLSCRVWARSGPYQPGGAFGFRDQLQDVMALLHVRPDLCRQQILSSASRQFVEGDVQHWWHPPSGRGTRTRCSDDLLWLPYVVAAYVSATGDESILDEVVPFLEAPLLEPDQHESYLLPEVSTSSATIFDHSTRAIAHATKYGAHGLPLIGSGDWNDGMNRVGHEGRGESVWLGWFLVTVFNEFAPLCERRGQKELARQYRDEARWLGGMLEMAWDGGWYRRAYFDDGTPLGSVLNEECRLDSLTQSWAVISQAARSDRAERAMDAVRANLVRRDARMVLLLTPPFDRMAHDPGYIKGYLPGIRENGGQYTHAALWAVIALARLGRGDAAMELFHLLNPINHMRTPEDVERYKTEPYAVAADVYAHPMHVGRGGWTWYTGSAGWMYQAAVRAICGIERHGDTIALNPCVPTVWTEFSIDWNICGTPYRFLISNPQHWSRGIASATLDGRAVDAARIPLQLDGERHEVAVLLGSGVRA